MFWLMKNTQNKCILNRYKIKFAVYLNNITKIFIICLLCLKCFAADYCMRTFD